MILSLTRDQRSPGHVDQLLNDEGKDAAGRMTAFEFTEAVSKQPTDTSGWLLIRRSLKGLRLRSSAAAINFGSDEA
jgi:hypothetical protein